MSCASRLVRSAVAVLAAICVVAASVPTVALADGDPGSDVLVYQNLFAGSDAGLLVQQQLALATLLKSAARAGVPVRVAIIAGPSDLGAVTALWRNPRGYARFLGTELSLAYKGRLLVVMPDGFGFNWPGHASGSTYRRLAGVPIRAGGDGFYRATSAAVRSMARAAGVKLPAVASSPSAPAQGGGAGTGSGLSTAPASGQGTANTLGIIVLSLIAIVVGGLGVRWALRHSGWRRPALRVQWGGRFWIPLVTILGAVAAVVLIVLRPTTPAPSQAAALASNPELDPGTPISGVAPGFTLSDQFGQPVSLRSFRGHTVILAFNDSECTTVCPLTTTAMMDAKAMLGRAGSRVQLLGIDADPAATAVEDVWSYSELHGMLHSWDFLTGSLPQLKQVWKHYGIEAAVERGQITHTPALFVIDPRGRLSRLYMTQMSYTAVPQLGQLLAKSSSALMPGRPAVHANISYARVQPTTPGTPATLPLARGGDINVGPGNAARLYLFFATWDQETSGLAGQLAALNSYEKLAARTGLPKLTAVDEASVEPSLSTVTQFLHRLPQPLSYPVALDRGGRIADGYEVLGLPWFVLISKSGRILYYRAMSTAGWPSTSVLARTMRAALARAPGPPGAETARQELAGSPPPLASLHVQAGQLLGGVQALRARLRALRGYPVVINAWASWCVPCRSEFGLFASASARYGRRVAFIGADTSDSAGDARTFLAQHPVSYPSYQTTTTDLSSLAAIEGLPTTIFINAAGKVIFVHVGQYDTQGTLDQDISRYAAVRQPRGSP
ncbi:MAG TPA: redoxin domain-containing protein [Solirubrobacteraceae bacterium]|nr:redoxin domain-containing protein [Solirubrobacteraceae bacterium]